MDFNKATTLFLISCFIVSIYYKNELVEKFKPHSSPVDWCEKNYTVSSHVAEFWNTLTSMLMIIPPLVAWYGHSGS
jgi:hypothetical protein